MLLLIVSGAGVFAADLQQTFSCISNILMQDGATQSVELVRSPALAIRTSYRNENGPLRTDLLRLYPAGRRWVDYRATPGSGVGPVERDAPLSRHYRDIAGRCDSMDIYDRERMNPVDDPGLRIIWPNGPPSDEYVRPRIDESIPSLPRE